jgi:hypothetical protein
LSQNSISIGVACSILMMSACSTPPGTNGTSAAAVSSEDAADALYADTTSGDGRAVLGFLGSAPPQLKGTLKPGGHLTVIASTERLPRCGHGSNGEGLDVWDLRVGGEFSRAEAASSHPFGDETMAEPHQARDPDTGAEATKDGTLIQFATHSGSPTNEVSPVAFSVDVPSDARRLVIYLHKAASTSGRLCEDYDSLGGKNYRFDVE